MTELALTEVTVRYRSLAALDAVSLDLAQGRVTSLVGPNGAGKSTLLSVAAGEMVPVDGSIRWDGSDLEAGPHLVAASGIRRTYQTPRVLLDHSVIDNVLVGTHTSERTSMLSDLFDTVGRHRSECRQRAAAADAIARVGLVDRVEDRAGSLSYGQVRLLELARALAARPRLILLDEPAAGLNDEETELLGDLFTGLAADGIGVVLVEHNLGLVTRISEMIHVLNFGRLIATGDPTTIVNDPVVIEAYTGQSA